MTNGSTRRTLSRQKTIISRTSLDHVSDTETGRGSEKKKKGEQSPEDKRRVEEPKSQTQIKQKRESERRNLLKYIRIPK